MHRIIIAAMTADRVIGNADGMPWDAPTDYQHFLDSVRGQTLLMGRKSWEIFGADVATAHNLVLSHSEVAIPDAVVVHHLPTAIALAAGYGKTLFIAGGASVYQQALDADLVDAMYLSIIPGTFSGDAHFPEFAPNRWHLVADEPRDGYRFTHYARNH